MISFKANFDAIGQLAGSFQGISEEMASPNYMQALIRDAHDAAADAFDVAAAATARANHSISHVYEYGNPGITPGPANFNDPTSPAARLYEHVITGRGNTQNIGFVFRPAREPNPQPTAASTGVSSIYLQKLSDREYIFYNRAYVMETGQEVEIHPKNGNFLFVPFYGQAPLDDKNNKGFMLWNATRNGPIVTNPGRKTQGNFSQFWMLWWQADGEALMRAKMTEAINYDVAIAVQEASRAMQATALKPVEAVSVTAAAGKARNFIKRLFGAGRRERNL